MAPASATPWKDLLLLSLMMFVHIVVDKATVVSVVGVQQIPLLPVIVAAFELSEPRVFDWHRLMEHQSGPC